MVIIVGPPNDIFGFTIEAPRFTLKTYSFNVIGGHFSLVVCGHLFKKKLYVVIINVGRFFGLNFKHKVLSLGSCDMKLTSFC